MKIIERYMLPLNIITTKRTEVIDANEDITVKKLIEKLITKYGKEFEDKIIIDSKGKYKIRILRNGEEITFYSRLNDNDKIILLYPLTGG